MTKLAGLLLALLALGATPAAAQRRWTMIEHFAGPFTANPYGQPMDALLVGADGPYCVGYSAPYADFLSLATFAPKRAAGGYTSLMTEVPANPTPTSNCSGGAGMTAWIGAEWATKQGWLANGPGQPPPYGASPYGYGYYEVAMRPTCSPGVSTSFFWVQAPSYGPLELDVEFPNDPGHVFTDVHWTIHPSGQTIDYQLGFNPCQAAHRYGFLWSAGQVQFTVDGAVKFTMTDPSLVSTQTGFVMGNTIPGIYDWGGGPSGTPNQTEADTRYLWWAFLANADPSNVPTY